MEFEPSVSEEDCNFAMDYLSGQCEEQTAIGANVTEVCNLGLSKDKTTGSSYRK
jgi:hypothetical protein